MVALEEIEPSKVQNFFKDTNIFITGGSGFLGMLLTQKLIRDCPDLANIYILIREKKGKTPKERMEKLFEDPVFGRMKTEKPNFSEKIKFIAGDLEKPDLAISEVDREIITKQINIVYHLAATVRFDEKIKKAVSINVRATLDVLKLARTITNLKALLYCSTAYSFSPYETIGEEFYDVHMPIERIFKITASLNDEELEILTPKLLGKWPNTYTFTKAIAEKYLQNDAKDLPIVIFRPSMVIPTVEDPVEGWINNFYGPVGIATGAGAGILRVALANPKLIGDMVPGDFVINNMIVSTTYAETAFTRRKQTENGVFDKIKLADGIPIFNCVSSVENAITWGEFNDYGIICCEKYQPLKCVWYYILLLVPNFYLYILLQFFLHKIPAFFTDMILKAKGKKLRLMKVYDMLDKMIDVISYFPTHEWIFKNDNTQALYKSMNSTDKKLFEFSMTKIDWKLYLTENFGKGCRQYMLKDPLETLPASNKRYNRLKIAHFSILYTAYAVLAYFAFRVLSWVLSMV